MNNPRPGMFGRGGTLPSRPMKSKSPYRTRRALQSEGPSMSRFRAGNSMPLASKPAMDRTEVNKRKDKLRCKQQ